MNLILRPLMPPPSLIMSQKATIALPLTPYAEAGPLYGQVWPILISLSLAPSSYFFCAYTPWGAEMAATADAPARNVLLLVFIDPPCGTLWSLTGSKPTPLQPQLRDQRVAARRGVEMKQEDARHLVGLEQTQRAR